MATTVDQVRLLTGLTDTELTEDDILTWLSINDDVVRLAAADALEAFAGTLATITVTSDDISLDGSKRAAVLMARAKSLRDQAVTAAAADGFVFDVSFDGCTHAELAPWDCG